MVQDNSNQPPPEPVKKVRDEPLPQKLSNDGWRTAAWAINWYTCLNGHITTTVDVDVGVTPGTIGCPTCKGLAISAVYPPHRPIAENVPEPTYEWCRMHWNWVKDQGPNEKYHHENGGLFMRKRTERKPMPYCQYLG